MKLAFSKPTQTAAEQTLLFAAFRKIGYEGLQLKGGQYARYLDSPEVFLAEWNPESGTTSALIAGGSLDENGVRELRRLFRFAQAVGSERIVFCHGRSRATVTDRDLREYACRLSGLGQEAAQQGLKISLHHHFDQPVMRRGDFDVFFGAAGDTVGLTVDTAHLVKSGITDIPELIRAFGPIIDNIHMKDFAAGEFRVLGQGEIDFAPVFAALHDIGYDGWLCADEESGSDLLGAMETCCRALIEYRRIS